MVEPQPSKLTTGVRFSSSAPLINTRTSQQLVLFLLSLVELGSTKNHPKKKI